MALGNPNMQVGKPSVNPAGRKPGVFSTFSDTASRLLNEYSRAELIAISDDEDRLNTFPAFQCLVIRQLAGALKAGGSDLQLNLREERERLYDRVMGKPAQKVEIDQTNVNINLFAKISEIDSTLATLDQEDVKALAPPEDDV